MTKSKVPQVKIVNAETGEEIIRDANAEELAQMEKDKSDYAAYQALLEARLKARAELLERLGITEDEAKLLFA